jgi:hypothetical protein
VELVVMEVVVVVFSVVLASSLDAFPAVPDAFPGVLASFELAFHSSCLPAVAEPPELFQLKCPSRTHKGSNTLKQE